jgi:hypothetical protein
MRGGDPELAGAAKEPVPVIRMLEALGSQPTCLLEVSFIPSFC